MYQRWLGSNCNIREVVYPTDISLQNPGRAAPRIYLKEVDLSRAKGDSNGCQGTKCGWLTVGIFQLSPSPGISGAGKSLFSKAAAPTDGPGGTKTPPSRPQFGTSSQGHPSFTADTSIATMPQPNFSLCPLHFLHRSQNTSQHTSFQQSQSQQLFPRQ